MAGLMKRVLFAGRGRANLAIASGAFALGLLLVLVAIQIHSSLNAMAGRGQGSGADAREYLILTKPVSAIHALSTVSKGMAAAFRKDELALLAEQPFVLDMAPFTGNRYPIRSNLAEQTGVYADLFFESVPDAFLDTVPPNWQWEQGNNSLPIIISRDWLDIYNFNVSAIYNLPQLTEETLSNIKFEVVIGSPGNEARFAAQIGAFSYRMPSLMVPMEFMQWANETYGSGEAQVNKVIIAVEDAADPGLKLFLDDNRFEANAEQTGRRSFRAVALAIVALAGGVGLLFLALSLVIVLLAMRLLVSDARQVLHLMALLGYLPATILNRFVRYTLWWLVPAALLAGGAWVAFAWWLGERLGTLLPASAPIISPLGYLAVPVLLLALIAVLAFSLRSHIHSTFRQTSISD